MKAYGVDGYVETEDVEKAAVAEVFPKVFELGLVVADGSFGFGGVGGGVVTRVSGAVCLVR